MACEDTRRTRTLLDRYGVSAKLVSYHEHNEEKRAAELVERMRAGATVALVSDAGMPLVSDPGLRAGALLRGRRLPVEVLPGPVRGDRRAGGLRAAGRTAGASPASCRASGASSPRAVGAGRDAGGVRGARPRAGHAEVLAEIDPERQVAVCRELTKVHEEVVRGSAAELAERYADKPPRARWCW